MDNEEWIYDFLKDMVEGFGIEVTDEISETITQYSKDISDGVIENYYCSSNYVADCNLRDSIKNNEKREVELLKKEIDALYEAARIKGYNFQYKNNEVYETGMEHVGGTVWADYSRIVTKA